MTRAHERKNAWIAGADPWRLFSRMIEPGAGWHYGLMSLEAEAILAPTNWKEQL